MHALRCLLVFADVPRTKLSSSSLIVKSTLSSNTSEYCLSFCFFKKAGKIEKLKKQSFHQSQQNFCFFYKNILFTRCTFFFRLFSKKKKNQLKSKTGLRYKKWKVEKEPGGFRIAW